MSTFEKAMELLQTMPEQKVEAIYTYMCFVNTQMDTEEGTPKKKMQKQLLVLPKNMPILI